MPASGRSSDSAGFGRRALRGAAWSALETLGVSGVALIVSVILARVLTPAEFGMIAMLQIFVAVSHVLVDSGFSSALIRCRRTALHESTALLLNTAVGLGIYAVLYLSAPIVADFYGMPSLAPVMRTLTLAIPLNALCVVQVARLTAEMKFRHLCAVNGAAAVVSAATGLTLAFAGYGVWALVWQQLSVWGTRTLLLWLTLRWTAPLRWGPREFREMSGFGWKLLVSSLIDNLWNNIYAPVLGRCFSLKATGWYWRADTLAMYGPVTLSTMLSRVAYPVFCRISADRLRMAEAMRRLIGVSAWVVFPFMALAMALAEPLFSLVLTDKWLPAVPYFRLLCAAAALYPLHALNLAALNAAGRSDLFLRLEIVKKCLGAAMLIATIPFGVWWVCAGILIFNIICVPVNGAYARTYAGMSWLRQWTVALPMAVSAAVGAMLAYLVCKLQMADWLRIAAGASVMALCYLAAGALWRWRWYDELKRLLDNG